MSVVWTGYGRDAFEALRRCVAAAKRDDPLAPVTVLVPTDPAGVAARRVLARGAGDRPGVAGLDVLTVDRLAERLGAAALVGSGRRPATNPVLAAAWRRALAAEPGVFAPVTQHPATVRALVAAHRELREAGEAGLGAIAAGGGPVAAGLVRLHRRVAADLAASWYDVTDLRHAAAAAVLRDPQVAAAIGAVLLFLPQDLPPGAAALVQALGSRVTWIAGVSGDRRADAAVTRIAPPPPKPHRPATARAVLHASDADDEVRCVVRRVVAAVARHPAHRVAVLYSAARPYARLLAEHLEAAGLRWNGAGVRPTIERTTARVLPDLLEAHAAGWRRADVTAWLAACPVLDAAGRRAPASRWERISRTAGVVGGDDWDFRLKAYATNERAAADREDGCEAPREWLVRRHRRDADAADALRAFVTDLRARLTEGASLTTWPALADWAAGTLTHLLGVEPRLPEAEARAAAAVSRTLAGLAALEAVEPVAHLDLLAATLALELADDLPRHGRSGDGVLCAPLAAAVGLDADVVFVVGLAEDLLPGRAGPDPLLPEPVRELAGGALALPRDRVDRAHRHLLAALAAAPDVTASFPRGDLRRSSARLPTRWLLPTLRALAGDDTVDATRWHTVPGLIASPSYAASLVRAERPGTAQEWRTRALLAGQRLDDPVLDAATTLHRARAGGLLTRFDGDLSGRRPPDPLAGPPFSPTSLEAWARCPHGWFLSRMLGVSPVEAPEELVTISPLEIGNLFHTALDRFFTAVGARDGAWTDADRELLRRLAREAADDLTARGATGHRLLWRHELGRILAELDAFLDDDERLRAGTGRRQERSELAFGMRGQPPVRVPLADGRVLLMKGSADRVDRSGGELVVTDFKSGSAYAYAGLGPDDPTAGGTKLQLPVYALAARQALGDPDTPVRAEYWFLHGDARGRRLELALTPQVDAAFTAAVTVLVDGIAAGLFPHRPPEDDGYGGFRPCAYCDPDGLGAADHRDRWRRKRTDPRLTGYVTLVEGTS